MGALFGRGFFIAGLLARIMYLSLRVMHDRALARRAGPQAKLH